MINRREALKLGAAGLVAPSLRVAAPQQTIAAQETGSSVPMFRGNAARTGEMPGPGPSLDKPIVVKWKFPTGGQIVSSPSIVNGVLYIASDDSHLYAIDADTGSVGWSFSTGESRFSSHAVVDDTVFAQSGLVLYALDAASGTEKWQLQTGSIISPVVANGIVYAGGTSYYGTTIYAIDALTGSELWTFDIASNVADAPAVVDGVVYAGSDSHSGGKNGNLYALDALSGSEIWRFSPGLYSVESPAVVEGVVYFGSGDSNLYALEAASGSEIWRLTTGGPIRSLPAVVNGIAYICSSDDNLYAVDTETGIEVWTFTNGGTSYGHSPAWSDDLLYIVRGDGHLYAVDTESGSEIWRLFSDRGIRSSPVVCDGIVYAGDRDGYLYALSNLETTILLLDTIIRGAPASSGVERGTATAGEVVTSVGVREEREGQMWAEVTIGDVTGWIPLDAIDPATLPPEGEIEYVYVPD